MAAVVSLHLVMLWIVGREERHNEVRNALGDISTIVHREVLRDQL